MTDKWYCANCDWRGEKYLIAENPFDPSENITGCPKCKEANSLEAACDEPECKQPATCGFPTDNGYRRTCFKHSKLARKP